MPADSLPTVATHVPLPLPFPSALVEPSAATSAHASSPTAAAATELHDLAPAPHPRNPRPRPAHPPETIHLLHGHASDPSDGDSYDDSYDSDASAPPSSATLQMSKRAAKKSNRKSVIRQGSTDSLNPSSDAGNGHANSSSSTAAMNGLVEHRRKHASIDASTPASQAASLMGRESFTLDDPVPDLGGNDEETSVGFSELSKKDQRNFLLLVLLYFLQGIPMGLATGSVPFLLKSVVSYSSIGVFSLAAYPYSLKLFWSPIVDAVWTPKLGRRKSWILPIQTVSGFSMVWLGSKVDKMMEYAGQKEGNGIWSFTWWWFALVFLCATQDIAVDGKEAPPSPPLSSSANR